VLETFTLATFAPHRSETFRIHPEGSLPFDAELIAADALGGDSAGGGEQAGRRAPFSLVFRGPTTPVLPQRIYRIEHPEIGAFDLFLVPIGPDSAGMRYEAIFT
jgi:hypothetical protein